MVLSVDSKTHQLIQRKVRSGKYASVDEVVRAGLAALSQQESIGDFEPDELNALLAEGEQSMQQGGIPANEVFKELRRRSQHRRTTRRRKSA